MKPDVNYRSYANEYGVKLVAEAIMPPAGERYSDTLKFSNCTEATVGFCVIHGSDEDVIDINNYCNEITIHGCDFYVKGKFGLTIKGGSKNVTVSRCNFIGSGKETDIDIGNWSDQSSELTTGIVLENLTRADGKHVRVRVLWGDAPTVIGGKVKVTVYPKIIVKIIRLAQKVYKKLFN
jgi:hypothetical protein